MTDRHDKDSLIPLYKYAYQPISAATSSTQDYHRILKGEETYYNKVKPLKYRESANDPVGHQKVVEKLSTPRIKYQTKRMLQAAQDVQNTSAKISSTQGIMMALGTGG